MHNNILFLINIIVASLFTLICLREGKLVSTGWVAVQAVLANVFVLKQIELLGLQVTASDVFSISGMLSVSLLQEFFNKSVAKEAVRGSCISLLFFAIVAQLHLRYIPSPADYAQPAYKVLFGPNFRIVLASITAYWLSQQCNIKGFNYLSSRFPKLGLQWRAMISVSLSQMLDTVLFAFLGLFGLVANLFQIILFSSTVKLVSLLLLSQVAMWAYAKRDFWVRADRSSC